MRPSSIRRWCASTPATSKKRSPISSPPRRWYLSVCGQAAARSAGRASCIASLARSPVLAHASCGGTRRGSGQLPVAELLVVGSGAAGLSAALKGAELGASVSLITAGALLSGSSPRAQGGGAPAEPHRHTPPFHAADTIPLGPPPDHPPP